MTSLAAAPAYLVDTPRVVLAPRAIVREIGRQFPVWLYWLFGIGITNTVVTNLDPPRPDLAYMAVFPLGWFCFYYFMRIARSTRLGGAGAKAGYALLVAAAAGLPWLAIMTGGKPSPLSRDTLFWIYEISNFAWLAACMAHCLFYRGARDFALFFVVIQLYGLILENGGIAFGFFQEFEYHFYIAAPTTLLTPHGHLPAPLATTVGWAMVFYMGIFWAEQIEAWWPRLGGRRVALAVLAALAATSADLFIDPLASHVGLWRWHASLPAWHYDVPFVNYVAWMWAIMPMAFAYFAIRALPRSAEAPAGPPWAWPEIRRLAWFILPICLAALAGFLTTMTLWEAGFAGPTYAIFGRFLTALFG